MLCRPQLLNVRPAHDHMAQKSFTLLMMTLSCNALLVCRRAPHHTTPTTAPTQARPQPRAQAGGQIPIQTRAVPRQAQSIPLPPRQQAAIRWTKRTPTRSSLNPNPDPDPNTGSVPVQAPPKAKQLAKANATKQRGMRVLGSPSRSPNPPPRSMPTAPHSRAAFRNARAAAL